MRKEDAEEIYNTLEGGITGQSQSQKMVPITPHITAKVLSPIPAGENPFRHDLSNMGAILASNITVMYHTHPDQKAEYLIIVNTETGERIRLVFKDAQEKTGTPCRQHQPVDQYDARCMVCGFNEDEHHHKPD